MEANTFIINPKTKVMQLIETYPQLEDVLIEYIPAFSKLKNPILRKTVAKVATLQQAAAIGKVKVEDLINRLRKEVGQELLTENTDSGYNTKKPEWFSSDKISEEFDVREMLESGEHPVNQVVSDLKNLEPGNIYKIIAPFIPAPLIDKASSLGYEHWIVEDKENLFLIYFSKAQSN
jgi:uncharacterized protein (DUF2249 family)